MLYQENLILQRGFKNFPSRLLSNHGDIKLYRENLKSTRNSTEINTSFTSHQNSTSEKTRHFTILLYVAKVDHNPAWCSVSCSACLAIATGLAMPPSLCHPLLAASPRCLNSKFTPSPSQQRETFTAKHTFQVTARGKTGLKIGQ